MKIDQLNLKKSIPKKLQSDLQNGDIDKPSKAELNKLLDRVSQAVKEKDYIVSINGISIAVYFDADKTFKHIKSKGLFRYSQNLQGKLLIPSLAQAFKDICKLFNCLEPERLIYLDSIIAMAPFHKFYTIIENEIVLLKRKFDKKFPNYSLIKTLLVYADFLFLNRSSYMYDREGKKDQLHSVEQLCSAVSYLIYFITSRFEYSSGRAAEEFIISGDISLILELTSHALDLREYEMLVEHFGYRCLVQENKLIIQAPFPDFEKSIRLGYIRTEIQKINDLIMSPKPPAMSLNDLAEGIINVASSDLFEKTDDSYKRYRMGLTEDNINLLNQKFFQPDELFLEEVLYLRGIIKEQLLTVDELRKIPIKDNLTLYDFVKGRRRFIIMGMLFYKYLIAVKEYDTGIILRSLVTQLNEEQLYILLDRIFGRDKAESFIDILCWEPGMKQLFDLQYQPLIFLEGHFDIPIFVLVESNAIRNLFASELKQNNTSLMKNGYLDPLVDQMKDILTRAIGNSYSNIKLPETDIDVCCVYGETLFVFECKHTLMPVNVFDLRTMYDYIRFAEKQLTIIETMFDNGTLLPILQKRGLGAEKIKKIQPCILVSNRLFCGHVFKYPIRYIKEVSNVLLTGEFTTPSGVYNLWPDLRLTTEFMQKYFSNDDETSKIHYECLLPRTKSHHLFNPLVEFKTYSMKMDFANKVVSKFAASLHKIRDYEIQNTASE